MRCADARLVMRGALLGSARRAGAVDHLVIGPDVRVDVAHSVVGHRDAGTVVPQPSDHIGLAAGRRNEIERLAVAVH